MMALTQTEMIEETLLVLTTQENYLFCRRDTLMSSGKAYFRKINPHEVLEIRQILVKHFKAKNGGEA